MSVYSIAVDLGGTNLRIAAVSDQGKMLEKITTGTEVKKGREFVIGEMTDAIRSLMTKHSSSGSLAGIGIGVPGFIDMDTDMVMRSPNLQDWANFPVRQVLPLPPRCAGCPIRPTTSSHISPHGFPRPPSPLHSSERTCGCSPGACTPAWPTR